jgi:hypothetical protein
VTVVTSTTTCVLQSESLEGSFKEGVDSLPNCLNTAAVKDSDSHLIKTYERSHANSARYQRVHSFSSEMIYRSHATALLVRHIGQKLDTLDLAIRYLDEGIEIAMSEVSTKR